MKSSAKPLLSFLSLLFISSFTYAGQYYALCEGNFGQANSSVWSINEDLTALEGPIELNGNSYWGDVGQSLVQYRNRLYAIMNNSHEIHYIDPTMGFPPNASLNLQGASPRYMAVDGQSGLGYVSCWNLSAILIIDLDHLTVLDTFNLGKLPEQMIIHNDMLFVSIPLQEDWSTENEVLQIDISNPEPVLAHTYEVIEGPGAMALYNQELYVTSIYYNDAWETFSGTSRINLVDQSVTTMDHGLYPNFTADIQIIDTSAYRTFGNAIVPLNEDLTLNTESAIGNISGIYTFSVHNNMVFIGSTDFIAPDLVSVISLDGQELASFNVGALPSQIVYYSTDISTTDEFIEVPAVFSLGHNYPNPFNPSTSIPFSLEKSGSVRLSIYDIRGVIVTTLIDEHLAAGSYISNWNGTNASGKAVSSGIYHGILKSNSQSRSIKLNLIK
mgnify:CR=1 FL=1